MVPVVRTGFLLSLPSQSPLNLMLTYACLTVSGAIYALASFFAFAAPRAQFLLFFVVPMPAWACISAIACFDVYNAFTRQVRRLFIFLLLWQKILPTVLHPR